MSDDATVPFVPDPFEPSAIDRARKLLDAPPTSIGPYRILEKIADGGMGEVYRGEQRSPIRREVAIKLIKLGMDTKLVIARFEAERQALAMMDHPHIARVYDAGADESGRPYFVMEYVKGTPITHYADEKKLTIHARLELFGQVCQAIQHAHHKGVIHRDLKPSNVLVITQDGKPFAKVIDFGIAKAMNARLTDKTLFTEHKMMIGTPEYMSPEQADGNIDIDTRTDVYSLGVLLYELLTGQTPFDGRRLRSAAYDAMVKIIREEEPPKPSTRLSTLTESPKSASKLAATPALGSDRLSPPLAGKVAVGEASSRGEGALERDVRSLQTVAKSRALDAIQLVKQVRGELDWLVMKALEKDRARRYATPTEVEQDVARFLSGAPIDAAPPSWAYRARKFGKKHRAAIAMVVLCMSILLAGAIGTGIGLMEAYKANRSLSVTIEQLRLTNRALTTANAQLENQASLATDAVANWMKEDPAASNVPLDPPTTKGVDIASMLPDQMLKIFRNGDLPTTSGIIDQSPLSNEERVRAALTIVRLGLRIRSEPPSEMVMPSEPFPIPDEGNRASTQPASTQPTLSQSENEQATTLPENLDD